MITSEGLLSIRNHVGEAFEAGLEAFPHFTLHGRQHLAELDRLALLVGGAIPSLEPDRLQLLRLALILHDYAMVHAPNSARLDELRGQVGADSTFADIVRKTHQDEIVRAFTSQEMLAFLRRSLPGASVHELEDACNVARHHRLHPLHSAPEHLRDLCALVRIVDELDIGPDRAPLAAYQAKRERMGAEERFHWLKHRVTRRIEHRTTFVPETPRPNFNVLRMFVAVKATASTWQPIQERVRTRLVECLETEGVNEILGSFLGAEFAITPARSDLCGASSWLDPLEEQDLNALPVEMLSGAKSPSSRPTTRERTPPAAESGPGPIVPPSNPAAAEFKLYAIPPGELAEYLCKGGGLTVIGNTYIAPEEEVVAGKPGAASRIYAGPADCGKTRAALEHIQRITKEAPSQWVVLRTGLGTLPDSGDKILLDTRHYDDWNVNLPIKAILFLDDLPRHLPPLDSPFPAVEATRTLFRWFHDHPHFREKRLVGTLRLEDVHARPEWPEILPELGLELELIRLVALNAEGYKALWIGMTVGQVCQRTEEGLRPFGLRIEEGFLEEVRSKPADPEAVAVFIQQRAFQKQEVLEVNDAEQFSTSAVETWLRETWPAIEKSLGLAARVFYTLARFFEAALRPGSGFQLSFGPRWDLHAALGPALCEREGGVAESYLPALRKLLAIGHAAGEEGESIRPKHDFLLQAEILSHVELVEPGPDWIEARLSSLGELDRLRLGAFLAIKWELNWMPTSEDAGWSAGWGLGLLFVALPPEEKAKATPLSEMAKRLLRRSIEARPIDGKIWDLLGAGISDIADLTEDEKESSTLLAEAIEAYRKVTQDDSSNAPAWTSLGICLRQLADLAAEREEKDRLRNEAINACRRATQADSNNSPAWTNLGFLLGKFADLAAEGEEKDRLRNEAIDAYRGATQADSNNSRAWNNLGVRLGQLADLAAEGGEKDRLRNEAIDAYRGATQADSNNSPAWNNLGIRLGQLADLAAEGGEKDRLRNEEIDAYRRATQADSNNAWAWNKLGIRLGQLADLAVEGGEKDRLRNEAIAAYRRATQADPNNSQAWNNFGISLGRFADLAAEGEEKDRLRNEEIDAYRRATQADSSNAWAWNNLGFRLGQLADRAAEGEEKDRLRNEAIDAYRRATQAEPNYVAAWDNFGAALLKRGHEQELREDFQSALGATRMAAELGGRRYNLACALSRTENIQEAFAELRSVFTRGEVTCDHVGADVDWDQLRKDPRFGEILSEARAREAEAKELAQGVA